MTTYRVLFATTLVLLTGFFTYGHVDISLDPDDWIDHMEIVNITSPRSLTQTDEGYLRATCYQQRGVINYRTKDTYNFQETVVRYKWRVFAYSNSSEVFSFTYDGVFPWRRMTTVGLSTSHAWVDGLGRPSPSFLLTYRLIP